MWDWLKLEIRCIRLTYRHWFSVILYVPKGSKTKHPNFLPVGWASSGRRPRCSSGHTPCCQLAGLVLPWFSEPSSGTVGRRTTIRPVYIFYGFPMLAQIKTKHLEMKNDELKSTDPDIIWRHGLQVVLKGLPPFDGRLELVHFDQVVCKKENKFRQKNYVHLQHLLYKSP